MRRTKRTIFVAGMILGVSIAAAPWVQGEPADVVPKAYVKSRYEGLVAHSPFVLATATTPAPVAQGSFAANWYVSGIGRIGGEDFVSIKSRDLSTQFSLYAGEKERAGEVALVSVTWSDVVGKSTVILRKGTETAKLEFNEEELHAAPAGSPAPKNATASNAPHPPANAAVPFQPSARTPAGLAALPVQRRRVAPIRPPQ